MPFFPPGVQLIVKWRKTMQDCKAHHIKQLPSIKNKYLCPMHAFKVLLSSRDLSPWDPLFASIIPPHKPVIDTHIRNALRYILLYRNIFPIYRGFHTFRRSGATFAFDHSAPLQNIMSHGLWKVLVCGPTFRMHQWPLLWFLPPFRPPFPLLSSLAWCF